MVCRLFSVLLLVSVGGGCALWSAQNPPSAEPGRTQRMSNLPYCAGGQRDKACIFGTDCRVTSEGCQVCQCEGLDD